MSELVTIIDYLLFVLSLGVITCAFVVFHERLIQRYGRTRAGVLAGLAAMATGGLLGFAWPPASPQVAIKESNNTIVQIGNDAATEALGTTQCR